VLKLTADDKVFEQANLLLWNPLAGPQLRAAVFKVLAATPGVQVNSHARDSLGRPAVEISWLDRVSGVTLATVRSSLSGSEGFFRDQGQAGVRTVPGAGTPMGLG